MHISSLGIHSCPVYIICTTSHFPSLQIILKQIPYIINILPLSLKNKDFFYKSEFCYLINGKESRINVILYYHPAIQQPSFTDRKPESREMKWLDLGPKTS